MFAVTVIRNSRPALRRGRDSRALVAAMAAARRAGFWVGRQVRFGSIEGRIIGYNIASDGICPGALFPLLVATEYGVTKCSVEELHRVG